MINFFKGLFKLLITSLAGILTIKGYHVYVGWLGIADQSTLTDMLLLGLVFYGWWIRMDKKDDGDKCPRHNSYESYPLDCGWNCPKEACNIRGETDD